MDKGLKIFLNLVLSLFLFVVSGIIQSTHFGLSMILLGYSIFNGIYIVFSNVSFEADPFRPEPMPPGLKDDNERRVRVIHEHHHHSFNQLTEGREVSKTLPDGSKISVRHVRRWDS